MAVSRVVLTTTSTSPAAWEGSRTDIDVFVIDAYAVTLEPPNWTDVTALNPVPVIVT